MYVSQHLMEKDPLFPSSSRAKKA